LHRAISNLVLNAMDAMPQGGTLRLRTRQEGGKVLIEVGDTGAGMTAEEREKNLYSLLYEQGAGHWTGTGDCAICGERSMEARSECKARRDRGTDVCNRVAGGGFLDRNVALDGDVVVWKEKILTAKYAKKCREGRKESS